MFNGKIVFDIADVKRLEVDLGAEMIPTKSVNKDDVIALGRKALKNRWLYKISYGNEKEYLESLDKMLTQLSSKAEYVNELTRTYEEVSITIYIRSEFAEIGCSIPSYILKKLSLLDCPLNFNILSFGMVTNAWNYDVYTPTTSNPSAIIRGITKKNTQTVGVVLDLSSSTVTMNDLGNILVRVKGAIEKNGGTCNIKDIVVIPK